MAKLPDKKTPSPAGDNGASPPKRRSPLTDFLDASEPLHRGGFAEAPQAVFSGARLTGAVSEWAEQIEREAEREGRPPTPTPSRHGGGRLGRAASEAPVPLRGGVGG